MTQTYDICFCVFSQSEICFPHVCVSCDHVSPATHNIYRTQRTNSGVLLGNATPALLLFSVFAIYTTLHYLGVERAAGGDEGGAEAAAHRFGEKHVGFVLAKTPIV